MAAVARYREFWEACQPSGEPATPAFLRLLAVLNGGLDHY